MGGEASTLSIWDLAAVSTGITQNYTGKEDLPQNLQSFRILIPSMLYLCSVTITDTRKKKKSFFKSCLNQDTCLNCRMKVKIEHFFSYYNYEIFLIESSDWYTTTVQ